MSRSEPGWGDDALLPSMLQLCRLGVSASVDRLVDRLQYTRYVVADIAVPEPDDAIPLRFQPPRARRVVLLLVAYRVMRAVDFDRQVGCQASEVDDIWSNRYLPPHATAQKWHLSEAMPKLRLGGGRALAQPSRGITAKSVDRL
jgi:hypothetical protein